MEKVTSDSTFEGYNPDKEWPHFAWSVTIKYGNRSITTNYRTGLAHCKPAPHPGGIMRRPLLVRMDAAIARAVGIARPSISDCEGYVKVTVPSTVDVLQSLQSDANSPNDFAEFCSDYGYDTDSRKAESIHTACMKIRLDLLDMFGPDFHRFMSVDFDDADAAASFIAGEV